MIDSELTDKILKPTGDVEVENSRMARQVSKISNRDRWQFGTTI